MKDVLNKFYRNHSLIYKGLLFIATTFLIVYMFPKSGKFKYNFERGKPWQSENLYAPFDFAIKKTDEEIATEKQAIIDNSVLYFNIDNAIENNVQIQFESAFKNTFADSIPTRIKDALFKAGKVAITELYSFGILSENYNFSDNKSVVILDCRVKKQSTIF